MSLRIGVIGVVYLGQHHARIFAELEHVELAGVSDTNTARADEIAAQYGCASFGDWEELVGQCDAVSIVTDAAARNHREKIRKDLKAF